jgi:hypothetical protein
MGTTKTAFSFINYEKSGFSIENANIDSVRKEM